MEKTNSPVTPVREPSGVEPKKTAPLSPASPAVFSNGVKIAKQKWQSTGGHDKLIFISTFIYLAVITAFMIWHQEFFSPDRFFVFAFIAMVIAGKAWSFLWDWLPPILLILGYDYLRGLVPLATTKVHIRAMIYFDKFVFFGNVPTLWLQHHFFQDGVILWYDNAAAVLYYLHFIIPLFVALLFWFIDKKIFKLYTTGIIIVSYAAWITYYIFPAMPPWMAAQQGFLPPVAHILDQTLAHFAHPISLPTVYNYVGANLVAAVPSLHAAYPMMTALFFYKKFPKWGMIFFVYPLLMFVTVMYLGEHYFFDIVVAAIYVYTIYGLLTDWHGITTWLKNKIRNLFHKKAPETIT